MASGKDIDTSTTEGPLRPIEKPREPGPVEHDRAKGGNGKHEMPEPGERVDDEAEDGEKRMTRQE